MPNTSKARSAEGLWCNRATKTRFYSSGNESQEQFSRLIRAVCVLEEWPAESLMMDITRENNFFETAFTVKEAGGYRLRWFTPGGEIDLCGHATLATAPGTAHDCVSRFFAPKLKVDEDPVTGSAHCMIAPYWANRLGKDVIRAYQASARGGEMVCELQGDRVVLLGKAALFSVSELML